MPRVDGKADGEKKTRTLEEDLEHTTSLFIDETTDTLHTTTTSETTDCGLGDSLDVVTKNLAMTLGSTPKDRGNDEDISHRGKAADDE